MKIKFLDNGEHEFDISQLENTEWPDDIAPYQANILGFCAEWLDGTEEFTFQTSGSTGIPKPIQLSRKQLELSAWMTLESLNLITGNTALVCINTGFIGGKMMIVRGLIGDLDLYICEPNSLPLQHIPKNVQIDFFSFVPFQLANILEKTPESIPLLNKAKAIILGGAPISPKLEQALQIITAPVYHTFGMTETVSHIALKRLNGSEKRDYFECLEGNTVSMDSRECLVIHSPLLDSKLVTNDQVELIDSTKFVWLGRADNVINSGGLKFQLEKVESSAEIALFGLREHYRSVAIGIPDEKLGERLELVIESVPFPTEKSENLLKVLSEVLEKYELPKAIRFLTRFPETESGKIDRKKILSLMTEKV
jgi:O-succinylbenzoic acid--CoA ligase